MKNNNKIFTIIADDKLSQECYDSYAKVYDFVTSRTDAPRIVTPYLFESTAHTYKIIELDLKK